MTAPQGRAALHLRRGRRTSAVSRVADALSRRDFIYLVLVLSALRQGRLVSGSRRPSALRYSSSVLVVLAWRTPRRKEDHMSDRTSFYPELARDIAPAEGKLGVLLPGLGAVATTLVAGVHLIQKGLARPFGSLTQMQKLRLGKRSRAALRADQGARAAGGSRDLVFGGWDIFPDNALRGGRQGRRRCRRRCSRPVSRSSRRVDALAGRLRARLGAATSTAPTSRRRRRRCTWPRRSCGTSRASATTNGVRARRHGLVRLDGGLRASARRSTRRCRPSRRA